MISYVSSDLWNSKLSEIWIEIFNLDLKFGRFVNASKYGFLFTFFPSTRCFQYKVGNSLKLMPNEGFEKS